jgi:hypothetical protein
MTIHQAVFLFAMAVLGGVLNSVAAGGGFLCFPALLFAGMPPIKANATNTAALWPAAAASTTAYRSLLAGYRRLLLPLTGTGIVGGTLGAALLLHTPQTTFLRMVPWLLLSATLLLAFSGPITRWLGMAAPGSDAGPGAFMAEPSRRRLLAAALLQMFIAMYIGFFGPGAGILTMALLALLGVRNIHAVNGLKTMLATISNGMALITFILARTIVWPQATVMIAGATLGGYGGAWYAQRLPSHYVRWFAIVTGAGMTVYFFIRTP